jgi:hypothetical protein
VSHQPSKYSDVARSSTERSAIFQTLCSRDDRNSDLLTWPYFRDRNHRPFAAQSAAANAPAPSSVATAERPMLLAHRASLEASAWSRRPSALTKTNVHLLAAITGVSNQIEVF